MKTRAKKTATSKAPPQSQESKAESTSKHTLSAAEQNPPTAFILTESTSADGLSRFVTLPHPAAGRSHRYYVDPKQGCYELTKVSVPKKACRSMLLTPDFQDDAIGAGDGERENGYMLKTPDLIIATPVDSLFLMLPALWSAGKSGAGEEWATFYDRLFSDENNGYMHLRQIFRSEAGNDLEIRMEGRMGAVCDNLDMGEDKLYKLNIDKLAAVLLQKAKRMVEVGLPVSMEEHFVRIPLEVPEISLRREDSSISMVEEADAAEGAGPQKKAHQANQELAHLLRIRTALKYLCTNYIPPTFAPRLLAIIFDTSEPQAIDFAPLDTHLASITKLKSEAQALRSISDNISRKRAGGQDEEGLEKAETKRRKKEEEERNKKNVSQGVKKLAKADTSGMKKLSSFFAKGAVAKKG
ncbi:hypothetical protein LTR78_000962 [Recurvomyces mirabilis]|uniref:Ribonuclease H2 subunit B n=1 Tax=Recurvomyces mirabilis TaxID=574656 RepID=A0AAE0WX22_9PEZI|nr:hypothetical protein LTR78_000962 [Recurvomyces mirabilis]KAK5158934.1 hypothetical protein LTS14_003042 [Recurvomyces mirabilis]